jgi:hypothetical protein
MISLAYGADVVETVVEHMKKLDSSFEVPDGFFPGLKR